MDDPKEAAFLEIFRRYTAGLRRANALDFDDLIGETVHLFRAFPDVAALYQRRFRHVLVDEYQDTNHAQYALIRELVQPVLPQHVPADTRMRVDADGGIPGASLTVVGDSDQSIYAFRGADMRNIVEFEQRLPASEGDPARAELPLDAEHPRRGERGHRQQLRPHRQEPVHRRSAPATRSSATPGTPGTTRRSSSPTRSRRCTKKGETYDDVAVFVRTNAQTRPLEEIFIRSGIPYRIPGGTKFYERAEIKDAMAYLIQVANPVDDLALRRIMNVPAPRHRPGDRGAPCRRTPTASGCSLRDALATRASWASARS